MTRENDWDIEVRPDPKVARFNDTAIVTNSDLWRVVGLGDDGSLDAMRIADHARATCDVGDRRAWQRSTERAQRRIMEQATERSCDTDRDIS